MMQLSKLDLEAAMMLSLHHPDLGNNPKGAPRQDHDAQTVNLRQPSSPADASVAQRLDHQTHKPVLADDVFHDGENSLPMFRSEEEFLETDSAASSPRSVAEPPNQIPNGKSQGQASLAGPDLEKIQQSNGQGPEPERGFLPVLRNRNFLTLWSGQVFSQLADKVYLVLMIALIANRFQAGGQTISGWVSSIMIAFTIPAVLFGSIAGVFVDRWPKKTVLVITNLLRGALVFTLPPLLWISKGWAPLAGLPVGFCVLLGITFLVSTLTQFFAPAEQSAIPLVVERRHLLSANSLYTTTMMASVIIGFAVGEPLLALADSLAAHLGWTAIGLGKELVVGSGYAIAGLILLLLRTREKVGNGSTANGAVNGHPEKTGNLHFAEDIRDGLRYLGKQHHVRNALVQLVILFSVFAALAVLSVRLAEVMPAIKSSQFGFLLAAGGVGMAIGATFIGQFGQRFLHHQLSLFGSVGMAASLLGLSIFSEQLIPALLLIMSMGLFAALVGVPMQTTIQEETPEEMRGKIFGLQNNAINIALSLPLALAGVAETFLGLRIVFIGLAVLVVAGGSFTWYISRTGPTSK
jgi:predicted MFS family arabinose efflux permease